MTEEQKQAAAERLKSARIDSDKIVINADW